jgi:hypothetical protein
MLSNPAASNPVTMGRLHRAAALLVHCYPDWEQRIAQTQPAAGACSRHLCEFEQIALNAATIGLEKAKAEGAAVSERVQ